MTDATKDPAAPPLAAYAFWLVPTIKEEKDRFQSLITDLAWLELPSPVFPPHITLIHPIPLSTSLVDIHTKLRGAIEAAAARHPLKDLKVELNPAQKGDKYYQSVLSPVTPSKDLLGLRTAVEDAFNIKNLPTYFPHLSLFYGGVSPERRDEIAAIANSKIGHLGDLEVAEVAIVSCVGTAEKWEVIGSEKLL
ncbi:uncharacterized protein I303_102438 [Kwoniella dejecticola CBS 10117]|uniref:2',3'-cyclic-nucleotide 3'-phosphodiesterase n=1 Tax=Kwoniella dejecticola CBS 10117 TaxID=1296121 RepID=A0A1A6A8Q8_9TREE|nr:uncharacterized protein I303_02453 [Kwoniella dejecticola CBS 10117]OBR86446.1 hypothetical protein I303_02453 [Kwoniella dejecticola CBS 10117]